MTVHDFTLTCDAAYVWQVHLVLQSVHPHLNDYLPWMQVLAVGTTFAEMSAGKTHRHRMDSMSARWQDYRDYIEKTGPAVG